jgi:hypothetical protein
MQTKFAKRVSLLNLMVLAASIIVPFASTDKVQAANLTNTSLRLDRMKATTATGGTVCTKPSTASIEDSVKVTFPTTFTVTATPANWTVTTTDLPGGTSAWPGIGTATNVTGKVVTFPSTDLTVGTTYCFNFAGTTTLITGTAGNDIAGKVETFNTGAVIDSANFATSVVSNDQIIISAVVPPIFSFILNGNTDAFTTDLSSTSVVSTAGRTASVATNAKNGWVTWVKSANAGLNSVSTGQAIPTAGTLDDTPTTLTPGTSQYVLDVDVTTDSAVGAGTVSQGVAYGAEYNGTTTSQGGTLSSSVFQPVAASDGTTGGDVLTLIERATVSAVQAAANDYTDTLTVIAAGRF